MIRHTSITDAKLIRAIRADNGIGYCNACGRKAKSFVEPDAERYPCTYASCGKPEVYGAEQILLLTVA